MIIGTKNKHMSFDDRIEIQEGSSLNYVNLVNYFFTFSRYIYTVHY